jgi:hypothetical protein
MVEYHRIQRKRTVLKNWNLNTLSIGSQTKSRGKMGRILEIRPSDLDATHIYVGWSMPPSYGFMPDGIGSRLLRFPTLAEVVVDWYFGKELF